MCAPSTISVIVNGLFFSGEKYELNIPRRSKSQEDEINVYGPFNIAEGL